MGNREEQVTDQGSRTSVVWDCDGIQLGHAISKFNDYLCFPASSQRDVVRLHFGLKGDYLFTYQQLNKTYDLIGGHHNIMYSKSFDMLVQVKTLELETFGIQFPRELFIRFTQNASELLKRFSDNILSGNSAILSESWGTIDSSIQQVIQQILHCPYQGDLKKLFLLSKSIELLVLSAESCNRAGVGEDRFLKNTSDKEKIMAVRDLIMEKLDDPPNLSQIARMVGLNEYKLKRGFKETFQTTIFGYLAEQRLQLAFQYLRDTEKTAAEIAADLGYSTPQHFNNAFKQKFGITPVSVRKNP
jgi:AraC family transcriptional regulator, transcriptional activator of the genes for pyochelin and ferripyochelin receptors